MSKIEKQLFLKICREELKARGFKKRRNFYYLSGREVLCCLMIFKSNYEPAYYFELRIYLIATESVQIDSIDIDLYDFNKRLKICPKIGHPTYCLEYEEYSEEEIREPFGNMIDEYVMPLITDGKKILKEKDKYWDFMLQLRRSRHADIFERLNS